MFVVVVVSCHFSPSGSRELQGGGGSGSRRKAPTMKGTVERKAVASHRVFPQVPNSEVSGNGGAAEQVGGGVGHPFYSPGTRRSGHPLSSPGRTAGRS